MVVNAPVFELLASGHADVEETLQGACLEVVEKEIECFQGLQEPFFG